MGISDFIFPYSERVSLRLGKWFAFDVAAHPSVQPFSSEAPYHLSPITYHLGLDPFSLLSLKKIPSLSCIAIYTASCCWIGFAFRVT